MVVQESPAHRVPELWGQRVHGEGVDPVGGCRGALRQEGCSDQASGKVALHDRTCWDHLGLDGLAGSTGTLDLQT